VPTNTLEYLSKTTAKLIV